MTVESSYREETDKAVLDSGLSALSVMAGITGAALTDKYAAKPLANSVDSIGKVNIDGQKSADIADMLRLEAYKRQVGNAGSPAGRSLLSDDVLQAVTRTLYGSHESNYLINTDRQVAREAWSNAHIQNALKAKPTYLEGRSSFNEAFAKVTPAVLESIGYKPETARELYTRDIQNNVRSVLEQSIEGKGSISSLSEHLGLSDLSSKSKLTYGILEEANRGRHKIDLQHANEFLKSQNLPEIRSQTGERLLTAGSTLARSLSTVVGLGILGTGLVYTNVYDNRIKPVIAKLTGS